MKLWVSSWFHYKEGKAEYCGIFVIAIGHIKKPSQTCIQNAQKVPQSETLTKVLWNKLQFPQELAQMTAEFPHTCVLFECGYWFAYPWSTCYTWSTHSAWFSEANGPTKSRHEGGWGGKLIFRVVIFWWAFCYTGWKLVPFWSVRICVRSFMTLGEHMLKIVHPPFSSGL